MLLDFRKLFAGTSEPFMRTLQLDLSNEDFGGYEINEPLNANINAHLNGSTVDLELNCDITVKFECARCTKEIEKPFSISRLFIVENDEWASDEGNFLPFLPNGKLDIREFVYSEILLEIPSVLLCEENCGGICQICGNIKPCNCTQNENNSTDERLLPLLNLLND